MCCQGGDIVPEAIFPLHFFFVCLHTLKGSSFVLLSGFVVICRQGAFNIKCVFFIGLLTSETTNETFECNVSVCL